MLKIFNSCAQVVPGERSQVTLCCMSNKIYCMDLNLFVIILFITFII